MDLSNADVYVQNQRGEKLGPFRGTLTARTLIVKDLKFHATEGDHILRTLPGGHDEAYLVRTATFNQGPAGLGLTHWNLDLEKTTAIPPRSSPKTTTINIHNSTGIQVGDHNLMNFQVAINEMIKKIDDSNSPPEEKAEAKSLLQAFLTHPLVVGIAGGIAGALM
ncbi:hypothetical protein MyNCGM121_39390 [Achromobacter xylosoxidans]|uniref:RIP homotypic interaction motif-containing protein n=1 Tax=Alcaligenes xylosoxydans xylosoxydans TaxID=85698 RepID=UPI000558CBCC|nr:RIP homotypic interaction motif-containing protein [Achromobacter xylosoxidans]